MQVRALHITTCTTALAPSQLNLNSTPIWQHSKTYNLSRYFRNTQKLYRLPDIVVPTTSEFKGNHILHLEASLSTSTIHLLLLPSLHMTPNYSFNLQNWDNLKSDTTFTCTRELNHRISWIIPNHTSTSPQTTSCTILEDKFRHRQLTQLLTISPIKLLTSLGMPPQTVALHKMTTCTLLLKLPLSSNTFSSQTLIPKFHFKTHIQMPPHNHTFWAYSSFTLWAGKSSIPKDHCKFVSKCHHHHHTFQAYTSFALWAGKTPTPKIPFKIHKQVPPHNHTF